MKTKKLVCYNCGGHGFIIATYESGQTSAICPVCGGIGTHEIQMTNADRIRAISDEELALWICGVYDIEEENGKFINGIIIPGYAPHDIEEWLQEPAGEEDKHETD